MVSLLQEETRSVMVEHGSFYFGNWPETSDSDDDPFDIEEPPASIVSFSSGGLGLFSDCGDENDTARVRVRFYDGPPAHEISHNAVVGHFRITEEELAVATLMMYPGRTMVAPFNGEVVTRVYRVPLPAEPEEIERDGEMHVVGEDWVIELWPSGR